MSGLIGDLLSAARALNAQTQGVNTAGKNMANVTNPAYARQRVILQDAGTIHDAERSRRAWGSKS